VRYYGHISKIKAVMRRELFPQEMHNPNAPHWIMTATTIWNQQTGKFSASARNKCVKANPDTAYSNSRYTLLKEV